MQRTDALIHAAHTLGERILEEENRWRMRPARRLFRLSRSMLNAIAHRLHELQTEAARLTRELRLERENKTAAHRKELKEVREAAERVGNRIDLALAELEKKKCGKHEKAAFAIILSPLQLKAIYLNSRQHRVSDDYSIRVSEYRGIRCYSAAGVYGPVVLTEDAFNAFSRNAPELLLKSA